MTTYYADTNREEKGRLSRELLDILARYGAESVEDLESKIGQGIVAEHPAWEDLIAVENLTARLGELDAQPGSLRSDGGDRRSG